MNHDLQDEVSLEISRRVARRLSAHPELLRVAQENLAKWSQRNANVPSLIRCYMEWQSLLASPVDEICRVLSADNEEARRLRQNSPFAGVLSPSEVWSIKTAIRAHHAKTAA
jgi:hypothetical protein